MKWTFQQVSGTSPKKLELDGYAAPFGRPRKDPVIKEVIKSRVQTTKYPGKTGAPTRHAFGVDWEPSELKGRWSTKHLPGTLTASEFADQWTNFVIDEANVEMSWGSLVSYVVFIDELELSRESEDDIAWKMHLLVDKRTANIQKTSLPGTTPSLLDMTDQILKAMISLGNIPRPPDLEDGLGFFDSPNLLIGQINSFPAALNKLVNQIGDIETATFGALNALRAGIVGFQTTVISARELISTLELDSRTFARTAKGDLSWSRWKSTFDSDSSVLLLILADLDRRAELGSSASTDGNVGKVATAIGGDTWESLAATATGSPENAGAIRTANGARYGERPIPGAVYQIPAVLPPLQQSRSRNGAPGRSIPQEPVRSIPQEPVRTR